MPLLGARARTHTLDAHAHTRVPRKRAPAGQTDPSGTCPSAPSSTPERPRVTGCQISASGLAVSSPARTARAADESVDRAVGIPGGPCHASPAIFARQSSATVVAWSARYSTLRASAMCRWAWPPLYVSLVEPCPIPTPASCSHSARTRPQAYAVIAEIASPTQHTSLAATGVPNARSRRLQAFSSMETNCSIFASVMVFVCGPSTARAAWCGLGVGDSPSTARAAWCADARACDFSPPRFRSAIGGGTGPSTGACAGANARRAPICSRAFDSASSQGRRVERHLTRRDCAKKATRGVRTVSFGHLRVVWGRPRSPFGGEFGHLRVVWGRIRRLTGSLRANLVTYGWFEGEFGHLRVVWGARF